MISIMHVVDSHVENPWFNGFAEYHDRERFRHVVTSIGPRCGMHDALEERGLRTFALGTTGSRKQHPAAIWRLRRLLREERIDIVQTHQFDPSIIGLVAGGLARTPVKVVTRHHSDFTTLFNKPLHRRLDRWQALCADHVIAASHAVKRAMMTYEGVPESKIAVAQYGYDFDVLRPTLDENERCALRRDLDAEDRLLLMTVSRLSIEKGLCYLVEAMQQVVAQRPDALLLILGPGPLEAELRRDIAERGLSEHVRLLGWRADARRLMQVADVMVHPTLHEAFCSVIIESMALERPLIATDVAAAPEQIDHNESGVLIPPRDPAAIARSILELADDPARRRRLGSEARRRVGERFNFPKMMRLYEDLYEQWYSERRGVPKLEFRNEVFGNEQECAESDSVRQPIDTVSVIAPVRNEADGVVDLLNALARQTRVPDEIVIADGGSHDGTQQKIREWRRTCDIPLTLVEDADAYPGRGRNLAISAARYDWIASIDAGVDPPANWLESLITAAPSGCEQGIVYGRYAARTNTWFTTCAAIAYVGPSDQDRKFIANSLFHRSVWETVGGFPEELRSGEDLLFFKALDRAMVATRFCRADPVVWEAQPTMARTFRRFALYSQHSIRAGLWREWHVRVGLQYAVMAALVVMGILAGWWWWLAAGGVVVARAMRRILAWHHALPWARRWAAALNPARLVTVIAINSVIDLAMVTGVVRWLLAGKKGANPARRPTAGGSAGEEASPAHHQESAIS